MGTTMTVAELASLARVSRNTVLAGCRAGLWGARLVCGGAGGVRARWEITEPPLDGPAVEPAVVAGYLRRSERLVRRWCRDGRIQAVVIGRQHRIPSAEALRLIERRM